MRLIGHLTRERLLNDRIARHIGLARQLHPALLDEGRQQRIHRPHDVPVAVDLVLAVFFDLADPLFLHIPRHHARKRAAQVGGEQVRFLVLVQRQVAHVLVGRLEGLLEFLVDLE